MRAVHSFLKHYYTKDSCKHLQAWMEIATDLHGGEIGCRHWKGNVKLTKRTGQPVTAQCRINTLDYLFLVSEHHYGLQQHVQQLHSTA